MESLKLYEELRRLLEFSGKSVQGVSLTADGAVGTVTDGKNQYMIFVSAKVPKKLKAV